LTNKNRFIVGITTQLAYNYIIYKLESKENQWYKSV
jgi:hypothetical protein